MISSSDNPKCSDFDIVVRMSQTGVFVALVDLDCQFMRLASLLFQKNWTYWRSGAKKTVQAILPNLEDTDMMNTGTGARAFMLIAALGLTVPLNGCANSGTRAWVAGLEASCRGGDRQACAQLPAAQAQASQETSENTENVALGLLLVPLVFLAAVAASRPPPPDEVIIVRRCRWC